MTGLFEKLGAGQSGRLAYQVLGRKGPIFNPTGIRYLSPDEVADLGIEIASTACEVAGGLAGLELAASLGAVALSAATYRSVQQLHAKVDMVSVSVAEMKDKLDALATRTKRIDARVAESSLREALKHAFRKAWSGSEIRLEPLSRLTGDIRGVLDTIEGPSTLDLSLQLASDVRDALRNLASLLRNVRATIAARHNLAVGGDPSRTLCMHPIDDYHPNLLDDARYAVAFLRSCHAIGGYSELSQQALGDRFSFADDEDRAYFAQLLDQQLETPTWQAFAGTSAVDLCIRLPKEAFDGQVSEVTNKIRSLVGTWLWHSDTALLLRTYVELVALGEGYEKIFWLAATAEQVKQFEPITVSCDLDFEMSGRADKKESGGFW